MIYNTKLLQVIDDLLQLKSRVVIAIDGRSAAGKTTLAAMLQKQYDAAVVHMDDFFLRPKQRTAERYAQPGGNVDWERFNEEILIPLKKRTPVVYRPFDCCSQQLQSPITLPERALTVVEGSYACHPAFWDNYDLHIFITIDPQTQLERIQQRNGISKAEIFREKWIPLEEAYFSHFDVSAKCDLCL